MLLLQHRLAYPSWYSVCFQQTIAIASSQNELEPHRLSEVKTSSIIPQHSQGIAKIFIVIISDYAHTVREEDTNLHLN